MTSSEFSNGHPFIYLPAAPSGEPLVAGVDKRAAEALRKTADHLSTEIVSQLPAPLSLSGCQMLYVAHNQLTCYEALECARQGARVAVWGWLLPEREIAAIQPHLLVVEGAFDADRVLRYWNNTGSYHPLPEERRATELLLALENHFHGVDFD